VHVEFLSSEVKLAVAAKAAAASTAVAAASGGLRCNFRPSE